MDTITTDTTTPDKAITVDVPADRVPEFYAWYARFLAGDALRGRGRGRSGRRHPHPHGGHHCRPDGEGRRGDLVDALREALHDRGPEPAPRTAEAPAPSTPGQADA